MSEDPNSPAPAGQPGQEPAGSKPAGSPDGGTPTPAPDTVSRAELDKVIGERQAAKERARKADEQAAALQKKLGEMPSADDLRAFQEWQANKDARDRDQAIKAGDVEAIEQRVREPLEGQIKALQGRNDALKGQITALLRDSALQAAAVSANAVSPSQVVALLRDRVKMTETDDGRFVPQFLDAEHQPLYDGNAQRVSTADLFVKLFLGQSENANLVKANTPAGSGAKPGGGAPDGIPRTIEEYNALPADQKVQVVAKMTPDQCRAILGFATGVPEGNFL